MEYLKKVSYVLVVILVVWILGSLFVLFQTPSVVFQNKASKTLKLNYGTYEQSFVNNSQGQKVSLWYFPSVNSHKVILFLHGNGGRGANIITSLNAQASVLSVAYPGYHESEGSPSVEGTYEAAILAYDWLVNDKRIEEKNIIIFGHSLGGSPAVNLAGSRPDANQLVLINTFSSVQSMCIRLISIFCAFNGGYFNTGLLASRVTIPVRQFAYIDDQTVLYSEGQKLFEYFSPGDKQFFTMNKGDHNNPDFEMIFKEVNI